MKKIIFDLDDTLYKSKELRVMREKAILDFLGNRTSEYLELRETHGTIAALEALGISKKQFYEIIEKIPINLNRDEKLIRILEELKRKYLIAIISNNSRKSIKEVIKKLGIENLIDNYFGGDDFKEIKPKNEVFSIVEKEDICIGNNFKKDLEIPKKKGAITILISDKEDCEADFTVPVVYDIKKIIESLEN